MVGAAQHIDETREGVGGVPGDEVNRRRLDARGTAQAEIGGDRVEPSRVACDEQQLGALGGVEPGRCLGDGRRRTENQNLHGYSLITFPSAARRRTKVRGRGADRTRRAGGSRGGTSSAAGVRPWRGRGARALLERWRRACQAAAGLSPRDWGNRVPESCPPSGRTAFPAKLIPRSP